MHTTSAYPFFLGLAAGICLTLAVLVLPGVMTTWLVPPQPSQTQAAVVASSAQASDDLAAASPTADDGGKATQTPTPVPASQPPTPTTVPTPAPQADPEQAPTDSNPDDRMRIANTDGEGVALRSEPDDAAREPAGFLEGQPVSVLERQGTDWVRVRGDDGREGWVSTAFLEPDACDGTQPESECAPPQ